MARFQTPLLLLLAGVMLAGAGGVQNSLNRSRDELGLTRNTPLDNAPPVLAFTTLALGGFRGLISNALWIRANDLQMDGKYFEMVQLADWITKLEPHFIQVWLVQAWNMSYNISVKFKDFGDRWRWVQQGITLLRDEGLVYNPYEPLIYRELGWHFQHKLGANLDDAHLYYKAEWMKQMAAVLGDQARPDFEALIHPQTEEQSKRSEVLRSRYKMDPVFMQELNKEYGPLDWRLPEASAIYWAALGLRRAKEEPDRFKGKDLMPLRRVVYQSMQLAFYRGRIVKNPIGEGFQLAPNLDLIDKVSNSYEQQMEEDPGNKDHIARAHRNFLRDAIYYLYTYNRMDEARKWFQYVIDNYPNDYLITGDTNSVPGNVSLDEFAYARVQEDVGETSQDRIRMIVQGLILSSFMALVADEDDHAAGLMVLASNVMSRFQKEIQGIEKRVGIGTFDEIRQAVLDGLLDPEKGIDPVARAKLRTKLNLPPEETPPPPKTAEPGPSPAAEG